MSITGEPGGRGVRAGVSIADITAGMYAAFGILAALHARQTTGRGQFIDVSMLEGQLGILSGMIGAFVADGIVPGPLGTAYGALLPYQTFRTKTRDIAIGIGSDKLWRTFCPLLGLPRFADDPRYVDQRGAQRQSAVARRDAAGGVSDEDATRSGKRFCMPAGIPMGAINTLDAVVAHPQVDARGATRRVDASGRRHDQDDGAAGADVGHARAPFARPRRCSASTPSRCLRERLGLGRRGDRSAACARA